MATSRIREFLDGNKVPYSSINHVCAYTAQEIAELAHVPGRYMAKVVIVWLDGALAFVVVPATETVDMAKLCRQTGRLTRDWRKKPISATDSGAARLERSRRLAISSAWRRCSIAASRGAQQFAFNAGTHRDVIVIRYVDYALLVRPRIVDVAAEPRSGALAASLPRPGSRDGADPWTKPSDGWTSDEPAAKEECGCAVLHHAAAD